MAEKHIFIGLGGSGVNTVSLLKYKLYERAKGTEMKSRLQVMNDTYRFIFVDTDSRDVNEANDKYRNLYEGGKTDFINKDELLNLGDINPYISYHEAENYPEMRINRRIMEACPSMVAESMENRDLSFGAGALRLKSRIAFGRKKKDFVEKLKKAIDELNPVENNTDKNVIHYWVVSSSNGGTGSGSVLDVLYLVNMIHRTYIDKGNPKVGLILYMPRAYMNVNPDNERYPRNAFAVFNELEAFQKWNKDKNRNLLYHRMSITEEYELFNEDMGFRPFEFCIPVDFHTENNNNMGDIGKMYSNTAELMFYIHSGQGAAGFKSFLDNNEDGDQINDPKFFLIPMGYMALRKPDEQFENYIALRSKYEMLRYGILGSNIESADERKRLMMTLFDTVIKSTLFESGAGKESYFRTIRGIVAEKLDDDMPDNLIRDNENKVVKKLPTNVSIESARDLIGNIETAIRRRSEEKNNTRKAIEHDLWAWAEENGRKWGLQYVKDILQELDAYCADIYMAYTTGTNTGILPAKCSCRKSLVESRDGIEGELDDLYQRAIQVELKERFTGGNADDVQTFFSRLKEWVEASAKVVLAEEAFDMIRELAYGDRGIIDRIVTHVRKLITEATAVLNGDKGVAQGYTGLARNFYLSKMDVTSVYVPDITEYVDGNGWREDGNLFSEWYSMIIGHTTDFVPGEGYMPLRNEDPACSLEALFSQMISLHSENMIQKKYFIDEESHLFTNTHITDFRRAIEDLLDYTVDTVKTLIHQNQTVSQQWYEKTLASFFLELNNEAARDIQQKAQPNLFFPYSKAKVASKITAKAFCVGPVGVVDKVFLGVAASDIHKSDDPSVMYKIVTKLGLSFEYYDLYQSIKTEYDKCKNKVFYHFHQAFATSGGDADNIKLPREIRPEQIDFTKYLILNQLSEVVSPIMVKGTETYNRENYADTPVIFDDSIVKFATSNALTLTDNGKIQLQLTDGDTVYYHTVTIDHQEERMSEMLVGFMEHFNIGRFGVLIDELIREINYLVPDLLRQNYQEAIKNLKVQLNAEWKQAEINNNKKEKDTIGDILRILNERLDTMAKFLSQKQYGG